MKKNHIGHVACLMHVAGIRAAVAMSLAFACLVVQGQSARGSMRQGAKKVSAAQAPAAAKKAKPAQKKKTAAPQQASKPVQSQFRRLPYVGALAADAETGRIIFSDNADRKAYPASVTKLMTALLVLEDVEKGRYTVPESPIPASDSTPPTTW